MKLFKKKGLSAILPSKSCHLLTTEGRVIQTNVQCYVFNDRTHFYYRQKKVYRFMNTIALVYLSKDPVSMLKMPTIANNWFCSTILLLDATFTIVYSIVMLKVEDTKL